MRAILAVVALAACTPKSAPDQAKAAADGDQKVGKLDGSLQPIGERGGVATTAGSKMQLELKDVSGGKACIIYTEYVPAQSRDGVEDRAQLEKKAAGMTVVAGATESLKTFKDWPDRNTGVKGKLVAAKRINKPFRDRDNQSHDSFYIDFTIEWCAPMPAIAASTKFITVSMFESGQDPTLYAWRIEGTPAASEGATTTTTTTEPPTGTSQPAKTSGNTVLDWLRDKRYDKFLQVAAAAGMEDELTKSGVIVFAAYDGLFPSTFDEIVADKSRALALFNDSIVDGTLTKQQLVDKGSVKLKTRSGKQVELTYDAKKERPFLDGVKLDRKIIETSNGTIFIRDTFVR